MRYLKQTIVLGVLAAFGSSCNFNIWKPLDGPGGDPQLLSAARAALDEGDFQTAYKYYGELDGNDADIANSEEIFGILTQYRVGMAAFATAFGTGNNKSPGKAITSIANSLGTLAGQTARVAIFQAFLQSQNNITTGSTLQGLAGFLTSMALIAEMLSEGAANPGSLQPTDLAAGGAACGSSSVCLTDAACDQPANSALGTGTLPLVQLNQVTLAQIQNSAYAPSMIMIQSAIEQIQASLQELGASGTLSNSVTSFTTSIPAASLAFSGQAPCYRSTLISDGFGGY